MAEDGHPSSPASVLGSPGEHWSRRPTRDIGRLMVQGRFDDVITVAETAARRAGATGDHSLWRSFTHYRAIGLSNLARYADVVPLCDAVAASAVEHGDDVALVDALAISAMALERLVRDEDGLRRLDEALAVAERLLRDDGRLDVLCRAAIAAAVFGMSDLSERIFSDVLAGIEARTAGHWAPGWKLWIKLNHAIIRCQQAVAAEHEGSVRSIERHESAIALCRASLDRAPDEKPVPEKPAAVFHAYEGFSLTALGRHAEATMPLALASAALPAEPFEMLTGTVDMLCGITRLRGVDVLDTALVDRVLAVTRRCGDLRLEAEVWRLVERAARAEGREVEASAAHERFETLIDRLDWRGRLQEARLRTFRSETLRRVGDGETWHPARGG